MNRWLKWAYLRLFIATVILAVVIAAVFIHISHRTRKLTSASNETASQAQIRLFKDAQTPDDMRVLAASYEQNGQYDLAKQTWQKIVKQTNQTTDYQSLLSVCIDHKVSDQQSCINQNAASLKQRVSSLDFSTAYSIGSSLDNSGNGKLAVAFYQRVLDVYQPSTNPDVHFMTQDELKAKINELNK